MRPGANDSILSSASKKSKSKGKPLQGFICRDKKGRIVAITEQNGVNAKRGEHQLIKHFKDKAHHRPFKRAFLSHLRIDCDDVAKLREKLHIAVESGGEGPPIPAPLTSWSQLALPTAIRQHLLKSGFVVPTPIQAQLIPALLTGRNCLGMAQTGSGKTLAYLLPLVVHVLAQPCETCRNPIGLVLSPTRELAVQIDQVLRPLAKAVGIAAVKVIGGLGKEAMENALSLGAHICIATPNCFFDTAVVDGITLSCHRLTMVVLDEVDRMLAMGFEEQVRAILTIVRPDRHIALLSATCSGPVQRLLQTIVKEYTKVAVNEMHGLTMNASIAQHFHCFSDKTLRIPKLLEIVSEKPPGTVLVFASTQHSTVLLSNTLTRKGIPSVALHGKMPQADRLKAMDLFDNGEAHVLVSTELAARGLDLRQLRCVINYAMPSKARDYIHRIGRTGRAGDEGESHSFILPTDASVCRGLSVALQQAGLPVPPEIRTYAKRAANDEQEFKTFAGTARKFKKAKKGMREDD